MPLDGTDLDGTHTATNESVSAARASAPREIPDDEHGDIVYPAAIPFVLVHLTCLAAIFTGITWRAVAICIVLYWLRIFAVGAGYHRYFSHRAFSTSRAFQFILALLSQSTAQKSVLIITCIPTPSATSTRRVTGASGIATSAGSSCAGTPRPTS